MVLTQKSSQTTDSSAVYGFMNRIFTGVDVNIQIETDASYILFGVDWIKTNNYIPNICSRSYGYYLHSSFKPKEAFRSICSSSVELKEYAWPYFGNLSPITIDETPVESVSFFIRNYTDTSFYTIGSITAFESGTLAKIFREGFDVTILIAAEEVYKADIVYFGTDNTVYVVVRNLVVYDNITQSLSFAHSLITLDGNEETLTQTQAGDLVRSWRDLSVLNTEIIVHDQWIKLYEVDTNGVTISGSFGNLVQSVRSGSKVKIVTEELSATVDTVVHLHSETRLLAILVEEYKQENGNFSDETLWRLIDTTGTQIVVKFYHNAFVEEISTKVSVEWFVDLTSWTEVLSPQFGVSDTSLLRQALNQGSTLRLQYVTTPGQAVFVGTDKVTVEGNVVTAMTARALLVDYSETIIYTATSDLVWWQFSTTGSAEKYMKTVSTGLHSSLTNVNAIEVTWFTN